MDDNQNIAPLIVWADKYSVGVAEIDNQHKKLIETINSLNEIIRTIPDKDKIEIIINNIVEYKKFHFATEEKYFHQFGFEGTTLHETAHHNFDINVKKLIETHSDNPLALAFSLIDFLEDWFLKHLTNMDQLYKKCFHEHGLT
jgi:hemerythrin